MHFSAIPFSLIAAIPAITSSPLSSTTNNNDSDNQLPKRAENIQCFISDTPATTKSCLASDSLWKARDLYCNRFWDMHPGFDYRFSENHEGWEGSGDGATKNTYSVTAQMASILGFKQQQDCWDVFGNIIDRCIKGNPDGKGFGGVWSEDGDENRMTVNACLESHKVG